METLLLKVKRFLREAGVRPRRRLGQSFMVDRGLLERLAEYGEVSSCDRVLEVGAGLGFLTEILAEKAGEVLAVEADFKLYRLLERKFRGKGNVKLFHGDFLKLRLEGLYDKVVSNPPYSISSPLIFRLAESPVKLAVLTLQREFAERLIARPGTAAYGRLTVMAYYWAEVEVLETVGKEAFYPPPKVESMVVRFKPRVKPPFKVEDYKFFSEVVKLLFTQRRRKLSRALQTLAKLKPELGLAKPFTGIPYLERRVFTLSPEEFAEVANVLWGLKTG
ncbi:MAG: ribosomal RNA small subunit methyltransferase A [Candidatus Hecatellales archaeon]|nr:MAG: ribosomal RNA small subunit methyltransferase A [Candidatus Hecatellales archaeon]